MRVTEQIDALTCLGRNPLHQLVVPALPGLRSAHPLIDHHGRFHGSHGRSHRLRIYGVEAHHYWLHAEILPSNLWDITAGLIKPLIFGAAIAVISCHRGFRGRPGPKAWAEPPPGFRFLLHRYSRARLLPGHVPEQPSRLPLALCGTANDLS